MLFQVAKLVDAIDRRFSYARMTGLPRGIANPPSEWLWAIGVEAGFVGRGSHENQPTHGAALCIRVALRYVSVSLVICDHMARLELKLRRGKSGGFCCKRRAELSAHSPLS